MSLYYCAQKILVSSANVIATSAFEKLGRLFTYNKNNNRPSIEHCGTPLLKNINLYIQI